MTKTEHWYDFIYEFLIRYYPSYPGVKMCLLAFSIASDILNEKKNINTIQKINNKYWYYLQFLQIIYYYMFNMHAHNTSPELSYAHCQV